mmetsp:Transcript_15576/g.28327  ORF Transcript_15576/g.28327 Transcript_15576/m.28327 type:complete len:93 (+) Transcript_15576:877-1155(+)
MSIVFLNLPTSSPSTTLMGMEIVAIMGRVHTLLHMGMMKLHLADSLQAPRARPLGVVAANLNQRQHLIVHRYSGGDAAAKRDRSVSGRARNA